jgi:hypothetical protein
MVASEPWDPEMEGSHALLRIVNVAISLYDLRGILRRAPA